MDLARPEQLPIYTQATEADPDIRAHIAAGSEAGIDEPVIVGTSYTVLAVWRAFQRVAGDRRGFRVRTPGLTEAQRMAAIQFVGKYPHYVAPDRDG